MVDEDGFGSVTEVALDREFSVTLNGKCPRCGTKLQVRVKSRPRRAVPTFPKKEWDEVWASFKRLFAKVVEKGCDL